MSGHYDIPTSGPRSESGIGGADSRPRRPVRRTGEERIARGQIWLVLWILICFWASFAALLFGWL